MSLINWIYEILGQSFEAVCLQNYIRWSSMEEHKFFVFYIL